MVLAPTEISLTSIAGKYCSSSRPVGTIFFRSSDFHNAKDYIMVPPAGSNGTPVSEVTKVCILVDLLNTPFLMFWQLQNVDKSEQPISADC